MKHIFAAALLTGALLYGSSFAQSTTPSSTDPSAPAPQDQSPQTQPQQPPRPQPQAQRSASPATSATKIAPGSVIPVTLTKTIDAKKVKTGDEVVAKVTEDMKTNSGEVLVPKDTKVVGHVTEAQARSKEQKESVVGIAFDHAVMKSGDVSLPMSIQAIVGAQSENPNATAGNEQPYPGSTGGSGGAPTAGSSGRPSGMGGSATPPPSGAGVPSDSPTGTHPTPQITSQTQGVIGMSHVTLSQGGAGTQASVVSSDKDNVKLESGTLLLLKVNQ
jgi:hypothetical protein